MNTPLRIRAAGTALCLPLLFSCGSDDDTSPAAATPMIAAAVPARCSAWRGGSLVSPETITVALAGQFEVPPVNTAGGGTGSFTVNRATGALSGSITVSGLSGNATAAHIHSAYAGVNGGVVVPLTADASVAGKFDVPATTTLAASDLATLLAGGMYVNAHTAANTGGEVRAQIVPSGIDLVRCEASGDFEVPAVSSSGSGIAYTTVDTASGAVVANVRTSNLSTASAAHLHQAYAGLSAGVIVPMSQTGGAGTDLWQASATLSPTQLAGYLAGEVYVNVHTPTNTGGEIRSQIVPKEIKVLRFGLSGSQQVPPVTYGSATATGYLTINESTGAVATNARSSGLTGASATHLHLAAAGANGSPILSMSQPNATTTPELWSASGTLSATQLTAYMANQLYLNIHTTAYPDGEIRGQIVRP